MRVTIIADDKKVNVDGFPIWPIDLTGLSSGIDAVQWYDTHGDVEFRYDPATQNKPQNAQITDFSPYQVFVDRYMAAKSSLPAAATPSSTTSASSAVNVIAS